MTAYAEQVCPGGRRTVLSFFSIQKSDLQGNGGVRMPLFLPRKPDPGRTEKKGVQKSKQDRDERETLQCIAADGYQAANGTFVAGTIVVRLVKNEVQGSEQNEKDQ